MPNDLRGQDVGVVGANGFIGSAILRCLLEKGISPRALCGPGSPIREPTTNIEYLTCDLNDSARLQLWINGLEVVIHSAGPPSVWQALSLRSERLRTINIGTGRGTSVAEFARYVLRTLDIDIPVVEEQSHSRPEESQIFELVADTSVARELLGWRAEIDLQEGLRRALGAKSSSQ